jgi:hypothetical protein
MPTMSIIPRQRAIKAIFDILLKIDKADGGAKRPRVSVSLGSFLQLWADRSVAHRLSAGPICLHKLQTYDGGVTWLRRWF